MDEKLARGLARSQLRPLVVAGQGREFSGLAEAGNPLAKRLRSTSIMLAKRIALRPQVADGLLDDFLGRNEPGRYVTSETNGAFRTGCVHEVVAYKSGDTTRICFVRSDIAIAPSFLHAEQSPMIDCGLHAFSRFIERSRENRTRRTLEVFAENAFLLIGILILSKARLPDGASGLPMPFLDGLALGEVTKDAQGIQPWSTKLTVGAEKAVHGRAGIDGTYRMATFIGPDELSSSQNAFRADMLSFIRERRIFQLLAACARLGGNIDETYSRLYPDVPNSGRGRVLNDGQVEAVEAFEALCRRHADALVAPKSRSRIGSSMEAEADEIGSNVPAISG